MSISEHIGRVAQRAEQPVSALLELTYRCNWRCSFCYNPRRADLAPLSTDEWIRLLPKLREAGVFTLILSGGEPLLHPGCVDIASRATRLGFLVTLFSNGSLIDDAMARDIAAARVFLVELSLHGATAATHEALTCAPGSFASLIRAAGVLREVGTRVRLKTTLTQLNENEVDGMRAIAAELDVPFSVDPTIIPTDSGDLSPLELTASDAAIRRELLRAVSSGELEAKERRLGEANCALGRSSIRVDPEGNVYPCSRWMTPIGNVREDSPLGIWSKPNRKVASRIADEVNDVLASSSPISVIPFCPALAVATGSVPSVPSAAQRHLIDLAGESWREVEAK